jgi:hypothetical protein
MPGAIPMQEFIFYFFGTAQVPKRKGRAPESLQEGAFLVDRDVAVK